MVLESLLPIVIMEMMLVFNVLVSSLTLVNFTQFIINIIEMRAPEPCTTGNLRLAGGTSSQGRVEICYKNMWGTICDDSWNEFDARVVCRILDYPPLGRLGKYCTLVFYWSSFIVLKLL